MINPPNSNILCPITICTSALKQMEISPKQQCFMSYHNLHPYFIANIDIPQTAIFCVLSHFALLLQSHMSNFKSQISQLRILNEFNYSLGLRSRPSAMTRIPGKSFSPQYQKLLNGPLNFKRSKYSSAYRFGFSVVSK